MFLGIIIPEKPAFRNIGTSWTDAESPNAETLNQSDYHST